MEKNQHLEKNGARMWTGLQSLTGNFSAGHVCPQHQSLLDHLQESCHFLQRLHGISIQEAHACDLHIPLGGCFISPPKGA